MTPMCAKPRAPPLPRTRDTVFLFVVDILSPHAFHRDASMCLTGDQQAHPGADCAWMVLMSTSAIDLTLHSIWWKPD
jgi:hypothetical protein